MEFTPKQGRYLAFIHSYTCRHGRPPAEAEIAMAMCVSPPSVNQMVKTLEKKGLIQRQPGQPRSLKILVHEDEIPEWNGRKQTSRMGTAATPAPAVKKMPPANLYVVSVYLINGPVGKKFAGKIVSRTIEIRGDQTLADLHNAIFEAYEREENHMYEFQFGKRPFDPKGPNYGNTRATDKKGTRDARTTTMDELKLKLQRVFGYWFDFGDNWYHELYIDKIDRAIPTITYPRVIKRVGKSPPQYPDD